MATAESQLIDWFTFVRQFKTCCRQVNTDAAALRCPDFLNATVATYLPDANDQNQFAVCAAHATGLPITPGSVSSADTFLGLLESSFGFLDVYVTAYLQSLSPPPFDTMNGGDYILQKISAVFPGGSTARAWGRINQGLARIMGDCYSAAQQQKAAAMIDDPTQTVNDVVNQIVVTG
jgi:hypothetical protein